MNKEPKSVFIKVRCQKCKNEQIIFSYPSTEVFCLVCGETLAATTGGKAKLKGYVLEVLK
jgi:small subunit ribosomal protein S27e